MVSWTSKTNTWTHWKNIPFFGLAKMKFLVKFLHNFFFTSPSCALWDFFNQKWKIYIIISIMTEFIWTCKNGNFFILFLRSPLFWSWEFFQLKMKKKEIIFKEFIFWSWKLTRWKNDLLKKNKKDFYLFICSFKKLIFGC